jgi:hypothetical protein
MIEGNVNEKLVPYRQKEGLNYSAVKVFDDKGVGVFYNEFILGLKTEKNTNATIIGNLVDDIVLTYKGDLVAFYQHFDEKYVKYDGVKSSSQVFVLADAIFDSMMETSVNGKITADFDVCFKEAFATVQEKGKYSGKTWEKGLEDFNKNGREYFQRKLESVGKMVVDINLLAKAEQVSATLLKDEITGPLLRGETLLTLPKLVVDFNYLGLKWKSELDLPAINHEEKYVQPFDLKCIFDNESFEYSYIKYKYYLQQAVYDTAMKSWMKENGLEDYELKPFKFIVADTSVNNRRPLIYELSETDRQNGYKGFALRGYKYEGIDALGTQIKWHMDNDVWNCSKLAYENNGHLILDINYDK